MLHIGENLWIGVSQMGMFITTEYASLYVDSTDGRMRLKL
jgi:hypothetical protein